ncbi:IS110 family transposase [Marinobacterium mangrovicola]|uniref:Transposase n=1 Tax=Marinobacterium mangrovicola TaxID=1476959 RepID=A0A4R1GIP5_9GAMM|nr:IS110 family transposase [Marinobacterium mangrovicola]TCK04152.1 transposase [Marinobacterium mangrovicola]
MAKVSIIGIDLAKHVFQLLGIDAQGRKIFSKRLKRYQLLAFLARQPECLVAIEACGGAHYWARQILALGHSVKMIHPRYVKPFVQVNKNDQRDAQAIAEAAARPGIPAVAVKTVDQQELQALHRVRERLVREKTSIGNELRGLLHEFGVIIPQGHKAIREAVPELLEDADNGLAPRSRELLADLQQQWLERDQRILRYDHELKSIARENPVCRRLQTVPGIGPVNATLLYSHAGDACYFASSRHFSASLGLVPRQHASGGKERLLGISKQGNKHVRKQLVHGARAAYKMLQSDEQSQLGRWLQRMKGKHPNTVITALANKLARIVWALMARGHSYQA